MRSRRARFYIWGIASALGGALVGAKSGIADACTGFLAGAAFGLALAACIDAVASVALRSHGRFCETLGGLRRVIVVVLLALAICTWALVVDTLVSGLRTR